MMLVTGKCTTRQLTKGVTPQLPHAPALAPGVGGIVGTVSDSAGALPHYSVLARAPGNSPNGPHASTTVDSQGGFVFDALQPGEYRLFVSAYSHRPDSVQVRVVAGEVDTVSLRPLFFECVR